MRRTARAAAFRLAAFAFAVLIAAPAVSAAPTPAFGGRSTSAAAPGPRTAITHQTRIQSTLHARGKVNVRTLPAAKHLKGQQGPLANVHLGRGNRASSTKPRAGGPRVASVIATTGSQPPIGGVTPSLAGLAFAASTATGFEPADPYVAVGPDHVVQVVNVEMRIQGRQGEGVGTHDTALSALFLLPSPLDNPPGPVTFNTDPRVIYDSLHGRWLASETSYDCDTYGGATFGHGYLDWAISDTADPTGLWTIYSLGYTDLLPDYPGVGTSTDKVVLSANMYAFTGPSCTFATSPGPPDIVALDWGQLAAGGNIEFIAVAAPGLFTVRPALQVPATSTTVFGVAEDLATGDVEYVTVTGTVPSPGSSLNISATDMTTGATALDAFADPTKLPDPRQPGVNSPLVGAVDERPTDAIWQANRLLFVATTNCHVPADTIDRDCVRVGELNTSTSPPSQRQDFLLSQNNEDLYFGGVGLSYNGSLHVTYSRSSPAASDYISGYAVYQLPGDPPNQVSPEEKVLAGTADYTLGDRWGDYLGVAADPQKPGAVWRTNQAASATHAWTTNIGMLNTQVGSSYKAITPVRVLDTRFNTGLSGPFHANVARSFQITGLGTGPNLIPANAVAITGNVAVVSQTATGYVAVTPRPTNSPSTASLNFPVGDVRANNVTLPLGPGGKISAVYKVRTSTPTTHLVFDVTGYFLADTTQTLYNPVTPARILDTRINLGLSGRFLTGVPRTLTVWGHGGVPANARAVTGNLAVTLQTASGYVGLTPDPDPNPATSTINFPVGDNRANGVTARLNATGQLSAVYKTKNGGQSTDLVFDVTGYYMDSASGGLLFYPLNPGRIMDTRAGMVLSGLSGPFTGSKDDSLNNRTLDTASHQGIPPTGLSITGNLAVVSATKAGYVAIKKTLGEVPETSSINFPVGDVRSNGVTVPLNTSGDLVLHYHTSGGGTVQVILDIAGYFAP